MRQFSNLVSSYITPYRLTNHPPTPDPVPSGVPRIIGILDDLFNKAKQGTRQNKFPPTGAEVSLHEQPSANHSYRAVHEKSSYLACHVLHFPNYILKTRG